ncbi:MAG TPA: 2-oxoacid:acceptor oxidoreductase family protein, partial [Geobacterales bacterium]|nr:2-oxoacid:acceptor oxidoreductase family protein [Geobacterales bacterium]
MLNFRGHSWLIGGAQGTGIERGASIFTSALALWGYRVFGKREYYSNIMGEHSYYYVRFDERPVHSHIERYHILTAYDAETVFRHSLEGVEGAALLFNQAHKSTKLASIHTIEERLAEDIAKRLGKQVKDVLLSDILEEAESYGIKVYPLDYNEILSKVASKTKETMVSLARTNNVVAVSASLALMGYELDSLIEAISYVFENKKRVVDLNAAVAEATYEHVRSKGYDTSFAIKLRKLNRNGKLLLVNGNQTVALGKLVAGCRFQTYYPITPASDESFFLEDNEIIDLQVTQEDFPVIQESKILDSTGSIVVFQTEDEIAAITAATGAALTGVRASTSTSGPGLSLMVEGLGWAGMNEVPVVVVHYQRGGPSTGLPTRTEQGDLRFVIHAGHGEFPRVVLASGDIEEAFYDTIRAFNYAEKYQLPVILLLDKYIANSLVSIEKLDVKKVKIERGEVLSEEDLLKLKSLNEEYKRFKFTETGVSPRVFAGTKHAVYWATGDEHDEAGHITEDPVLRQKMMEKRMSKLNLIE